MPCSGLPLYGKIQLKQLYCKLALRNFPFLFQAGGMKAGTFDPYPSHSAEPYVVKYSKPITTNKEGRIFHPPPGSKSRPSTSIMALNVTR